MSIVLITIVGSAKMAFAGALHHQTGGAVALVIQQRWKPDSYGSKLRRLAKRGPARLVEELFSAMLLRLMYRYRKTLNYFREATPVSPVGPLPNSIIVDDINSPEVLEMIKKISPDLLVVWGSKILQPRLIGTAKCAVNLHMGRCPHYRGTLANQCAVLNDDKEHIGATVHFVEEHVDAGPILSVIKPDLSLSPKKLFRDLNDRAQAAYIDIVSRLHGGENMQSYPQDEKKGKNLLMREWTPYVRFQTARRIRRWERSFGEEETGLPVTASN